MPAMSWKSFAFVSALALTVPAGALGASAAIECSKIGLAYPGDQRFHYIQITNPALHYEARVFYVDPLVHEGQAIHIGQAIGRDHSLQARYRGITNHVHLEIERIGGRKLDPTRFIAERMQPVQLQAANNQPAPPARG